MFVVLCPLLWAPAEIFVVGGGASSKKAAAPHKDQKGPYIAEQAPTKRKKVTERPPHREKGPPKEKMYKKCPS